MESHRGQAQMIEEGVRYLDFVLGGNLLLRELVEEPDSLVRMERTRSRKGGQEE
jgi:hypothetical protein